VSRRTPRRAAPLVLRTLGAGRIALGSSICVATDRSLAGLGFERPEPLTRALARLAGSRDVALGAIALTASGNDGLRRAAIAGAACDASDAVAFSIAAMQRGELDRATLGGAGLAAAAVAAGLWALAVLGRD
jgi:hypothetical protein